MILLGCWLAWVVGAAGCQLADLRTEALRNAEPGDRQIETARHIYMGALDRLGGYARYQRFQVKILKGTDIWHSTWVRWFTPVTEDRQAFEVQIRQSPDVIRYRFLNGKRRGDVIGVDPTGTFYESRQQRRYTDSSSVRLYLEPLRDYFEWPFKLMESPILVNAGSRVIRDRTYDLIFAATGGMAPSKTHDQFLIYIHRQTGRIDYLEFTLRDLMQSYKGALHYLDYRESSGLRVLARIGVGDTVTDDTYVHVFEFDDIQLITEQPAP
jgi:hypothetical protein